LVEMLVGWTNASSSNFGENAGYGANANNSNFWYEAGYLATGKWIKFHG
jgi:hypothetical protein